MTARLAGVRSTTPTGAASAASAAIPTRTAVSRGGAPTGPATGTAPTAPPPGRKRRRRLRRTLVVLVIVLALVIAWPLGLVWWANGKLSRVDALSGAADTPGTTYLIAGSDSRADGTIEDESTSGQRADTIMLLQVPASGPNALISIPRDTYVEIPGHGSNKINAAYAWGGAPLLVQTVEGLTGMTIDHYVEVGFGGVENVVDALGGIELCYDAVVNDVDSGMVWEKPGCQTVNGVQALAFSRMRKADPNGDIGRTQRQRQVVQAIASSIAKPGVVVNPAKQLNVLKSGIASLSVDESTGVIDLAKMALAFKRANGVGGIAMTPPIASLDYRPGGVGSTVQLDPDQAPAFFAAVMNGTYPPTQ